MNFCMKMGKCRQLPGYFQIVRCLKPSSRDPGNTSSLWGFCLLPPIPTPRYEDEINRRAAAENDFVVLKKVRDEGGARGAVRAPLPLGVVFGLNHGFGSSWPHLYPTWYYPDLCGQRSEYLGQTLRNRSWGRSP